MPCCPQDMKIKRIPVFISVCETQAFWVEESITVFIGTAWDYIVTFFSCFPYRVLYLFYCAIKWLQLGNVFQRCISSLLQQCLSAVDST